MKFYLLKHMYLGYVCAGSFVYSLFPPLAIFKAEMWWQSLGLLYFFWLCAGKTTTGATKPWFCTKGNKTPKIFCSSLIASPATFSRFAGINGGRDTAQLAVQSWAPLSFITAWVRRRLRAEACLSPWLLRELLIYAKVGLLPCSPVLTEQVTRSHFSP